MTPREKVLSIGVGVALVVAAGSYALSGIRKGFRAKYDRIDQLQSDLMKKDTQITDGLLDRNKLAAIATRSLPKDIERAQGDYNAWLLQVSEEAGLRGPKQTFNNRQQQERGVYNLYKFTLSGMGTIENLTKLLYGFYQKDYLHRITSLKVTPVANAPYQLTISLSGDVLGLEVASPKQPPPDTISHRVDKSLEEYQDAILKRNLFSPANHAPAWPDRLTRQAFPRPIFQL
jgi:hypothetical protein